MRKQVWLEVTIVVKQTLRNALWLKEAMIGGGVCHCAKSRQRNDILSDVFSRAGPKDTIMNGTLHDNNW